MKILRKNKIKFFVLGFGLWALSFELWGNGARADSFIAFYQNTKTIVVAAKAGGTPNTESSKKGYQAILNSPELQPENIQNIAGSYFQKNLKKDIPVLIPKDTFDFPMTPETMIYKFHYSVREIEIDGKEQKIGSISLNLWRPMSNSEGSFYTTYQWEPVESFVISDDRKKLQKDLENTIEGMLERHVMSINQYK